jgi:hypothetical protein
MTSHNLNSLQTLLRSAAALVKRHNEVALARKENFNIFEVLRLATDEQRLHSRFIAHLLDPNGTHEMGSVFLEKFLHMVQLELDIASTQVYTEFHTGRVDKERTQGGSIDILLRDQNPRTVSIENKIYAGLQPKQLERYANYNKDKNKVVYLTLFGESDEDEDANNTQVKQKEDKEFNDYISIRYSDEIIDWLDQCHRLAIDHPTLRETIKQYRQTVAIITNQMNAKENEELTRLLLKDFESAHYVATNYDKIRLELADRLRHAVIERLTDKLDRCFIVSVGESITKRFAQIWVELSLGNGKFDKVKFVIEPFNRGHSHPNLFVGIFDANDPKEVGFSQKYFSDRTNPYWSRLKNITPFKGEEIRMTNPRLIGMIGTDAATFDALADHISKEAAEFIAEYADGLKHYAGVR